MNKYLGDYNIAKSSSNNMRNILWTKKNPEKLKNKKHHSDKKSSSTNIIYGDNPKQKSHLKKVFIINQEEIPEKLKNKNIHSDKKFQKSSADNCNIKQGFKRPGR